MDELKSNERFPSVSTTSIPNSYKAVVHVVSLLVPVVALMMVAYYSGEKERPPGVWDLPPFVVGLIALIFLLYTTAGGFNWDERSLGSWRALLYVLLGGIVLSIPLFLFWFLVRVIGALVFRLPIALAAGKIWIRLK